MGLASALSTALTGLTAAETQIDVVGNNLANSQTVGFKESGLSFTTQFLQTMGLGSAPTDSTGGTNPRQTGLGTKVAEVSPDFTQGTIQSSSAPSDLALQGDGFFMVEDSSGEVMFTRSGIFKTNADDELVTVNGQRLLGYTVDEEFQLQTTQLAPLVVPVGSARVAEATQNVFLEGTLTPTGNVADTAGVIESAVLGDGAMPRPDASDVSAGASSTPNERRVTVAFSDGGGSLVEGATYRYRFAYANATGNEGTPSEELLAHVPAGNGVPDNVVDLTGLPATTSYSTLRIYRTAADGSDFYYLDSVDVSGGSPVSYSDTGATSLDLSRPLETTELTGNYSYLITYGKEGQEESRPSLLVGPVNVVNGRVHLQDLPTPPTPGPDDMFPAYDKICIYRNLATDQSNYYLIDEVDVGMDYTDTTSDAEAVLNRQIDLDGPKVDANTLLVNVVRRDDLSFESLFELGTLEYTGRKGGRSLETKNFEVTSESTVQDLMDFIRQAEGLQQAADDPGNPIPNSTNNIAGDASALAPGLKLTPEGRIRVVSNNGTDNAVSIGLSAFTMRGTDGHISTPNMGFATVQEAAGQSAVADFLVYDSLGVPINVRVTAVMQARDSSSTTYRWFADSPDNEPLSGASISVGTGLVSFDGQGRFLTASNTEVSIGRRNSPAVSPLMFDLDFSAISGLASDKSTLAASRQDGSSSGTLANFSVGEDGVIRGSFSNGVSRTLGQIRLARFANPAGLDQRGQSLFAVGANSGLAVEGNPGENGTATLVAGAVELSNTDIGQNLIDLVLATTQYRGNTRVITAAQQLLDELLNLRR